MSTTEERGPDSPARSDDPRSITLLALFLAIGLIALAYVWIVLHGPRTRWLSANAGAVRSNAMIMNWIEHGYFASHGLLMPSRQERTIYRSVSGGYMLSGFLVEKAWVAATGHYGWRLLALHDQALALLTSSLLAMLAYRIIRRLAIAPLQALVLAVCAQMVQFTFPNNLALFWEITPQASWLAPALLFLLVEERRAEGRHMRMSAVVQALAVLAMTYLEYVATTMFLLAYLATVLLVRGQRPPIKRMVLILLVPVVAATAIFAIQVAGARAERQRTGVRLYGSSILYRTGLDGDAMFYGDPLDIAFRRDVVRQGRPGNRQALFHWPWLFLAGVASVLITLAAFIRGRAPAPALLVLMSLLGMYVLYAAVFSQAVMLHPYLYDVLLATPLILALFGIAPALAESRSGGTGVIVLVMLFCAIWTAMFQLRLHALAYPLPDPSVQRVPSGGP